MTTVDDRTDQATATRPWWRRFWLPLALVGVVVFIALAGIAFFGVFYARADVPDPGSLVVPDPTVIYDAYGEKVGTFELGSVRRNVQLSDLPDHVPQAVLAAEDRGFYSHPGFDATRIAAAFWDNLTGDSGQVEGASTITQQYIELAVEEVERSYIGKLREVALATKLEQRLSKDEILERYLNAVPFGRTAVGIEAAAQVYFGKPAAQLNVEQAATLAGMIAAPTTFDPARNPEGAKRRRNYVVEGMAAKGWISQQRAQQIIGSPLPSVREEPLVEFGPNSWYLSVVREQLKQMSEELGVDDVALGLEVHTNLNQRMQRLAIEQLREHLAEVPYQGSIVSIDPQNGGIMALVGQKSLNATGSNYAMLPDQQAGSAFKPFTLAAFVSEGYTPDSVYDAPASIDLDLDANDDECGSEYSDDENGDGSADDIYEVSNYANAGFGDLTVRQATRNSVNTVYVQMQQDLCTDAVVETATSLLGREEGALPSVASLTLGTASVSPVEMANAYATIANGGLRYEPWTIAKIGRQGSEETVFERDLEPERVLEEDTAALVTDVLTEVVERGTATAADIDRPAAGKTGTTQEYRDAWFVGFVPQLATAVWVGYGDNQVMEERITGGSIPAETWGDYMAAVLEGQKELEFPEPDASGLEEIDDDGRSRSFDDDDTSSSSTPDRTSITESPSPEPTETSAEPTPTPTGDGGTEDGGGDGDGGDDDGGGIVPVPSDEPSSEPEPSPTGSDEGDSGGGSSEPSDGGSSEPSGGGSSEPSDGRSSEPSGSSTSEPSDVSTSEPTGGGTASPSG